MPRHSTPSMSVERERQAFSGGIGSWRRAGCQSEGMGERPTVMRKGLGGMIARLVVSLLLTAPVFVQAQSRAIRSSIPGDADCDGLLRIGDRDRLIAEIFDGDGERIDDAGDGRVESCSGVDSDADGRVSVADLLTSSLFRSGQGTQTAGSGPVITYLGLASADGDSSSRGAT